MGRAVPAGGGKAGAGPAIPPPRGRAGGGAGRGERRISALSISAAQTCSGLRSPRPATCGQPRTDLHPAEPPLPHPRVAVTARCAPPPCPPVARAPPPNLRGGRRGRCPRCGRLCCSVSSGCLGADREPVSTMRPAPHLPWEARIGRPGGQPRGREEKRGRERHLDSPGTKEGGPRGALTCGAHGATTQWPKNTRYVPEAFLPGSPLRGRPARLVLRDIVVSRNPLQGAGTPRGAHVCVLDHRA